MVPFFRLVLVCLLAAPAVAVAAPRPYTVDDMLRVEEIGKVRFDVRGRRLIFERLGPYEEQGDFGRPFVKGGARSKIYAADLTEAGAPVLLFRQRAEHSYTLDSLSPDGRMAAYDVVSRQAGLAKGVVTLGRRRGVLFDINPAYVRKPETPWTAEGGLVVAALGQGQVPTALGLFAETREGVIADWRASRDGSKATASAVGSGRFAAVRDRGEHLVVIDAGTRQARPLASGRYGIRSVAPDGAMLAALREDKLQVGPGQLIDHGANIGAVQHTLAVFDLAGGGAPAWPCAGCDVLKSSLRWSADSRYLAFAARMTDTPWSNAAYRVYDRDTGRTHVVETGDHAPYADYGTVFLELGSAWLGDDLVVRAAPRPRPDATGRKETLRADWFLVSGGALRNLTDGFDGEAPELIAVGRDRLALIHQGDLWAVTASGERRNLTESIEADVRAWRRPADNGGASGPVLRPTDVVTLQIGGESGSAPKTLLFVDLASGQVDSLAGPSATARVVAVSAVARRAAFVDRAAGATALTVIDADGTARPIVEINAHLKGVVGGTPVRIDHQGPNGDARISWLLTPPGHREGDRLPTVVNVYPGSVGRAMFRRFRLDQVHALNDHILAARGYGVLFPSLPVNYAQVPRDPLSGLVADVFAAIDAAAAAGYVDPERLAIQGQSYGGYTTGALVGLTDRFKAAVGQAGVYNLVSAYGMTDIRRRPELEHEGLDFFGASWAETSQGGMGAPVWGDPDRYLRNSPLMHVANVSTPILLFHGDYDYVSMTQSEEYFTALSRLDKDAVFVRYFGEGHVFSSPANIRDMWARIFDWYGMYLGAPYGAPLQ